MSINNVEIQDSAGNVYYPHTDADIVKFGETTVGASLSELANYNESNYNSIQSINPSADTNLLLGSLANANFITITTDTMKFNKAGTYLLVLKSSAYNMPMGKGFGTQIRKNGTLYKVRSQTISVGLEYTTISYSTLIKVNANDVLIFELMHNNTSAINFTMNEIELIWLKEA